MGQELHTHPEHLSSYQFVCVLYILVYLFAFCLVSIVVSVLHQFTTSDYSISFSKLVFLMDAKLLYHNSN